MDYLVICGVSAVPNEAFLSLNFSPFNIGKYGTDLLRTLVNFPSPSGSWFSGCFLTVANITLVTGQRTAKVQAIDGSSDY